jgi:Ca2+-binding EF-hand superfamily protein
MAGAEARMLFDTLDLNRNGVLTRGELVTALRVKGCTASRDNGELAFWGFDSYDAVADFFDQADSDHNKEITVEEFTTALDNHAITNS